MNSAARRKQNRPPQDPKETKKILAAYRVFEQSVDGQIVLQDLCDSYYDRTSFVPGDSHATAYAEGQRSVVLAIFEILEELKQRK